MGSTGLSRIAPGLYSGSPRYTNWFSDRPSSMKMGFGLGALSSVGGERFKATEDVDAYIAKAGFSMDIYSPES